jgi:hypothetical protein
MQIDGQTETGKEKELAVKELKTVILYPCAVAAVVACAGLYPHESDLTVDELLPAAATPNTLAEAPVKTPSEAVQGDCTIMPQAVTLQRITSGDTAGLLATTNVIPADLKGGHLIMSGTIYASDCLTPLPGALIEVWHARPVHYLRGVPFLWREQMRADAAGRYEFATIKSGHEFLPAYLHYRVSYQGRGVLFTRPLVAGVLYPKSGPATMPMLAKPYIEQVVEPVGPVVQGTLDIVLPVPAPDQSGLSSARQPVAR